MKSFHIGIPLAKRDETRHHVTVSHHFLIEVDDAIGIHKQTDAVPRIGRRQAAESGATIAGRFTRMPFMCTWLRLTIMKLARRKNMISISGMISMRALFWNWRSERHSGRVRLELGALQRIGDRHNDLVISARLTAPAHERVDRSLIENRAPGALGG